MNARQLLDAVRGPRGDANAPTRWWHLRRWESTWIGTVFGADLRSLAVFRIAMALVVLWDAINRVPNLRIHYTDAGIMPRSLLVDEFVRWRWSVNLVNDTWTFQMLCLLVTAVAAICLALGYRTRVMAVIVWVMITSIQVRNPLVLSGADTFLRVLLFWMMFLPLGAVWSIDSLRAGVNRARVSYRFLSLATVGLFGQVAFVYLFTALLKTSPEWRSDGTALEYALHAHHITRPFGEWLGQFPMLLRLLTHGTLLLEFAVIVLIFAPVLNGPLRTLVVVSVMSLHLGIFLTMDVGLFPFISSACMLAVLPTWFWETVAPRLRRLLPSWIATLPVEMGRMVGSLRERAVPAGLLGPQVQLATAAVPASTRQETRSRPGGGAGAVDRPVVEREENRTWVVRSLPITNVFMAFCLVFVFMWNLTTVTDATLPAQARPFAYTTGLYQSWNMFAPHPSKGTVWLVVRGVLADGREVDLLTPVVHQDLERVPRLSWEQPDNIVGEYYGDKYWRKYLTALGNESKGDERRAFAAYTCRTWNAHYGGDVELAGLQIIRMSQATRLEGEEAPVRRKVVSQFRCV